jgi:drug/metabolite transporter (DMT)-like permease
MRQKTIGILAALSAALSWGIGTVISKEILVQLPSIFLLMAQLIASVFFLWFIVVVKCIHKPGLRSTMQFAWLGVFEPGLAYLLGLVALSNLTASAAVLIQSLESMIIIFFSAIILKELPSKLFLGCSVLALTGLCGALGVIGQVSKIHFGAVLLMLIATGSAALYVVMSSRAAAVVNSIYIVTCQQTVALFLVLGVWCLIGPHSIPSVALHANLTFWLWVFVSGFIQYALGFCLYIYALKTISPNQAGSFLALTPLFGIVCAWLYLGETLTTLQIIGAAITVLAVLTINLGSCSYVRKFTTFIFKPIV